MPSNTWVRCTEKNIDVHERFCSACHGKMTVNFRKIAGIPDTFQECRAMMEKRALQKTK